MKRNGIRIYKCGFNSVSLNVIYIFLGIYCVRAYLNDSYGTEL